MRLSQRPEEPLRDERDQGRDARGDHPRLWAGGVLDPRGLDV